VARAALTSLAIALLVSLGGPGCATIRRTGCPAHGGPAWNDFVSDHFVVRTDLPPKRAGQLVGRLERMRAAVQSALGVEQGLPGRIEVIAFRTKTQFKQFAPTYSAGYYLRVSGGPPRIVLSSRIGSAERSLLAHELTHHYMSAAYWRQPRWLSEGMAVYMESLGEDEPTDDTVTLGGLPSSRYARARLGLVPVRQLLVWDGTLDREPHDYYASAWVLVHYLLHQRPDAFADMRRRLAAGEPPLSAWRAALPEYLPETGAALEGLDLTLEAYLRSSMLRDHRELKVPPVVAYLQQPTPPGEYHAIRLTLWDVGPGRGTEALAAEVEEALEEAPDHPIALQVKAQVLKEGDAVEMARHAVASWPDDPRAWAFLGQSLPVGDERTETYRRAVDLAPNNPALLHELAEDLLSRGRPGEALPFARRAAIAAPWSSPVLATHAQALSEVGWCAQALPSQVRAIEALPESTPPDRRKAYLASLEGYLAQCRASPPGTAPHPPPGDGTPSPGDRAGPATLPVSRRGG